MGDRVSLSFVRGKEESVALFNHWGGREFPQLAQQFVREWRKEHCKKSSISTPASRADPDMMMVQFIAWLAQRKDEPNEGEMMVDALAGSKHVVAPVSESIYLGATDGDGDNSDNGHWKVNVQNGTFV